MAERWRKPVVPLAINDHDSETLLLPDGRQQREAVLTLAEDDKERMRQGYVCMKCLEPFERPWPERCHVCGAPIRTKQAEFFANEFGGETHLGSRLSLADELESLKQGEEEP